MKKKTKNKHDKNHENETQQDNKQTLTELPGEADGALQRRVVEGVSAVHHSGVGHGEFDGP